MDIDILFSKTGETGLIASENFVKKIAGALIDTATGILSIEYADMDHMDFNIPIDANIVKMLDFVQTIQIGAVVGGHIAQAYQIPLMFLNDPYRGNVMANAQENPYPLSVFERFIKNAVSGQPVHRENLEDDQTQGCVLGDASPSSLQFAPHLARRQSLEISPQQPAAPGNAPGIGLGGSGGGTNTGGNRGGGNSQQ